MYKYLVLIFFLCSAGAASLDSKDRELTAKSIGNACQPVPPTFTSPKTGQKAWDKCIEYQEELIYPCLKNGSRSNQCGHQAEELILRDSAYANEFPHMALLGNDHPDLKWFCNGVLISDRFILAAGHCTLNREVGPPNTVALGSLKIQDIKDSNLYKLSEIIRHPSYEPPLKYNDIALYKTEKQVVFDRSVVPACLHIGDDIGNRGIHTGWNLWDYQDQTSSTLQMASFNKYSDDECKEVIPISRLLKTGINSTTQICFGDKRDGNSRCQAQSGGPIQVRSKKMYCMYVIVGVSSFGTFCGERPEVYTRVSAFIPWIESVVWPTV